MRIVLAILMCACSLAMASVSQAQTIGELRATAIVATAQVRAAIVQMTADAPTPTPAPTRTPTETPAPTSTPTPTSTPLPTSTPTPDTRMTVVYRSLERLTEPLPSATPLVASNAARPKSQPDYAQAVALAVLGVIAIAGITLLYRLVFGKERTEPNE